MSQIRRKEEIRQELARVRRKTLRLLERVPQDFFTVRVHDFYSPIGWHFGHVGMTEEFWVCEQAMGKPCGDEALRFLFANIPENPKDNRVHLPSREEIVGYLAETRCRALQALDETNLDTASPLLADGYAWEFALQHECQHQETIVELLQLIQKQSANQPNVSRTNSASRVREAGEWTQSRGPDPGGPVGARQASPWAGLALPLPAPYGELGTFLYPVQTPMISIPGGVFVMGSDERHGYDNEKQAQEITIAPFELDAAPVTVAAWMAFMRAGGYQRPELWTEAGWEWRQRENAEHPEYWRPLGAEAYGYCAPNGVRPLHPAEPASSLSWYEADAYARWAGKRLPTEAEWEFAASFDPVSGRKRRFPWGDDPDSEGRADSDLRRLAPLPIQHDVQPNAFGLWNMAGSVWEWTSTPFLPYPGFEAFPYDGYSKDHFDGNHFVCRGGSWATDRRILRSSFRNWYVPTYRQGLLGMRCAR